MLRPRRIDVHVGSGDPSKSRPTDRRAGLERGRAVPAPALRVDERDGVVIVTPVGALHDPLPVALVERLEAVTSGRPVIVDMSEVILVSAAAVTGLVAWVIAATQEQGQCCLVCPRATAQALLGRWHVTRCLAVFRSVGDALQARRFGDEGYGTGWNAR